MLTPLTKTILTVGAIMLFCFIAGSKDKQAYEDCVANSKQSKETCSHYTGYTP